MVCFSSQSSWLIVWGWRWKVPATPLGLHAASGLFCLCCRKYEACVLKIRCWTVCVRVCVCGWFSSLWAAVDLWMSTSEWSFSDTCGVTPWRVCVPHCACDMARCNAPTHCCTETSTTMLPCIVTMGITPPWLRGGLHPLRVFKFQQKQLVHLFFKWAQLTITS